MEPQAPKVLATVTLAILGSLLPAAPAPKEKKRAEKFGVIAGTVFQESGLSLRGARVTITPAPEDGSKVDRKRTKTAITDSRGEFAVRVPAGAMRYTVRVEADGWQPAEKTVVVQWEERVDVFFRLTPEGSPK